jgi:hypothetical protein
MARLGMGGSEFGTEAVRVRDRARRVVLLIAALFALALAFSPRAAAFVYWVDGSAGTIARANLDGSGANQSFITPETSACGVAVDGAHVYWANRTFQGGTTIGRANLDGSGVDQGFITGADNPCGVAVDGAHVYWANERAGTIGRANLDGSGVDQSFITGGSGPHWLAVDSAHVYWSNSYPGPHGFFYGTFIARANLDGTCAIQRFIFASPGTSSGVAVDAGGPQPSNPPPNEFSLGKARRNEKKGTAKVPADVPGSGDLVLAGKGIRPAAKDAAGAGEVKLPVKPTAKTNKRLNQKGEAKAKVEVTFTPTKGCPNTESKKIKLVKRH